MSELNELKNELNQYLSEEESARVEKAYLFAKAAHGTQARYSGEPYITHPLEVARILAEMRMDPPTLIAALLHDVVEDTPVNAQEITAQFGKEVADLVDGVTKLKFIHFENYAQAQAENFRKMVMAMASDIRVILIKLADRLHNMRTLYALPLAKRRRIALETLEIFAPIANRLGMHGFRVELEDLGFASLYPMRYQILKNAIQKAHGNRLEMIEMIEKEVNQALKKAGISSAILAGREKHIYSIYKKMHEKHLLFSEIMDRYGFRIIVDNIDTCYRVLGVLHNLFKPIAQRFKDYVAIPKANGYQSLHTVLFGPFGVPIEMQIRTEEMHHLAENGIAAHWLYKTEKKVFHQPNPRTKQWLSSILEIDKNSKNSLEFIENVKIDLFPHEVYIFTPKGKIIELPAGATPVDFAFAIHSDIGNTCVAARINKRLASLSTPLTSGQQVEIITAPGARPNGAWLHFVVTGKARSKIKHYLKKQQREESVELGRRLIEKALAPYQIGLETLSEQALSQLVQQTQLDSISHLFEEVGMGNRPAALVAKLIARHLGSEHKQENTKTPLAEPLIIKGSEGLVMTFAKCCRPIPGDSIVGLLKEDLGIEVHLFNCPLVEKHHHQPEKTVPLVWEENIKGEFSVDLRVDLLNRRGSLASLAYVIAEADSNIENIGAQETDQNHFIINITITAHHRSHLAQILKKIRKQKEVINVVRYRPRVDSAM